MPATVLIPRRFNGPPDSGHGGYSCALAARFVDGPAEVTLRVPPPLETPMEVEQADGGAVLRSGDTVVAEAQPARVDVEPRPAVDAAVAERASRDSAFLLDTHPFPTCVACGPLREPGDGLRIFAGPVRGEELFAAPWTPDAWLAGDGGRVEDDYVWTALDCPSSAPALSRDGDPPVVLARLAVRIDDPPVACRPHVIQSWPIAREGRKHHTGVALFDDSGRLRALGRALWIELRPKG